MKRRRAVRIRRGPNEGSVDLWRRRSPSAPPVAPQVEQKPPPGASSAMTRRSISLPPGTRASPPAAGGHPADVAWVTASPDWKEAWPPSWVAGGSYAGSMPFVADRRGRAETDGPAGRVAFQLFGDFFGLGWAAGRINVGGEFHYTSYLVSLNDKVCWSRKELCLASNKNGISRPARLPLERLCKCQGRVRIIHSLGKLQWENVPAHPTNHVSHGGRVDPRQV